MSNQIGIIYLIEKAWWDRDENEAGNAFGYSPFAFVESKEVAEKICSSSKVLDKSLCWAICDNRLEFRYKEIKHFNFSPLSTTVGCTPPV